MSIQLTQLFEVETCCSCGVSFAVPSLFQRERRADQRLFYCPNGHGQSYSESTVNLVRREKAESERVLQAQLNEANHARLVAEKAAKKAQADKRKVERRIAHGVCPCCNKTFVDLSNHMMTEHKDFRLPEGKLPKQITGPVQ